MDIGEYVGTSAIIVSIFLATAVFIWQSGRSYVRLDRLDASIDRLDAKIEALGERLSAEIRAQSGELREHGRRVSDLELEQARLNGVNSVLANQFHTHDSAD